MIGRVFGLLRQHGLLPLLFTCAASGKFMRFLLLSSLAGLSLAAQAVGEDTFLEKLQPPLEQTMGQGRSVLWTLPDLATLYQPYHATPAMQAALQAQQKGRFLDALILLEEAEKGTQPSTEAREEIDLLRASFLLQGQQSQQALDILAPLLGKARHAADAWVLAAMAHLQQGQTQQALEAAQQARAAADGMLPHLALSYALQGAGRLTEAYEAIHAFNVSTSNAGAPQAVALAREAELALMLDRVQTAKALVAKAQESWAANPYVVAVGGLTDLMEGNAAKAKDEFEAVLHYDPKDTKALLGLGLAEIQLGDLQKGLKKLQEANAAAPDNALILTYLGRAQQQSGQTEAAMESYYRAQQADSKDPIPWLYQAQAELQASRLLDARNSLREAQARTGYRSVYRSAQLLQEDEQLLQANLAEIQRRLGMESIAFHTLADTASEKNAANLRNQADLLQGQRFGESARRSLLLQSLFNDRPGNLPAALDIYGDGAGQTGASTPQHGSVSELNAQQTSYNNYDELFGGHTLLEADVVSGSKNTNGEQVRLGVGNDMLGLSIAGLQFKTDGFARFDNLDNRAGQVIAQWRPLQSTQAFVSYQAFNSQHGETLYPADIGNAVQPMMIVDNSKVTHLGLRHDLAENNELRALWSHQQTDQKYDYLDIVSGASLFTVLGSSKAHSAELQYRRSGVGYATQWGVQQFRAQTIYVGSSDFTRTAQQLYVAWQQTPNPEWQMDAGLGWGKIDNHDNLQTWVDNSTSLARWQPKLGLVYTPDAATHLRLAAWRGVGVHAVGDATLAPTSLAGIVLSRPGDSGRLVHAAALGADRQLSPAWLLAAQIQRHKTGEPIIFGGQQMLLERRVDESILVLHWQPESQPWSVNLAYDQERFQAPPLETGAANDSVQEQSLRAQQLDIRWFVGAQWTANLVLSHNRVDGTLQTNFWATLLPYQESFNQVDANLDWQFAKFGSLTAGVRNATDRRFQYTNIDPLNPRFSNGRMVYGKLKFSW